MKIQFTYLKSGKTTTVDYTDGVLTSDDEAQQESIDRWLETKDAESFVLKFSHWDNGYVKSEVIEEDGETAIEEIPEETE